MKKLLFIGIGSALMFTMGGVGPAQADNGPHISTAVTERGTFSVAGVGPGGGAMRCAGCHKAHTAKAEYLLKDTQPALCYTCHGGGWGAKTDVQNGKSGSSGAALRGGGFEYALIGADAGSKHMEPPATVGGRWLTTLQTVPVGASEKTTSKHQIDGVTSGTMWGNGAVSATITSGKAAVTLECGSCHDPHGNGNYRILTAQPALGGTLVPTVIEPAVPQGLNADGSVKAAIAAVMSPGAEGVAIGDAPSGLVTDTAAARDAARDLSHIYTTDNYWSVVDRNVPVTKGGAPAGVGVTDGYIANVAQWCSTCHTRYLAGSGSYEKPLTSGTGAATVTDAAFTYRHRSNRTDKAGASRPNCIQCHVSHGSNAEMTGASASVPYPGQVATGNGGSLASTQEGYGDSKLLRVDQRGTCVMCHNV